MSVGDFISLMFLVMPYWPLYMLGGTVILALLVSLTSRIERRRYPGPRTRMRE